MRWHDWLYEQVCEICGDREYLYLSFYRGFAAIAEQIYQNGGVQPCGNTVINGLKSEYSLHISWQLESRANFFGSNSFTLTVEKQNKLTGCTEETRIKRFNFSSGEEE